MKTILIIANSSDGLYGFRKDLIQDIVSKGYRVVAAVPLEKRVEELKSLNIELIDLPIDRRGVNPIKDSSLFVNCFKLINKIKPYSVITYTIKPNLYAGLICRMLNVKYFSNITGLGSVFQKESFLKKAIVFMYKISLKRSEKVFFENVGNRNVFVESKIVKNDKTVVLNGAGVNLNDYQFQEYPTESENIRFLFIARIMKEKGIDEFLYAAKKIKEDYCDIQFDIVGAYEDDYSSVVKQYVNEGIVNYFGFQTDVRPFIKKCHCFVLPSYHEGMANTNLECASMGRPLITSNIHGCKEAVVENVTGFLCEKENKDDLYSSILKFIKLSYDEKKKMGIESRKHMENVFDKRKVVKKTVERLSL